MKTEFFDKKLTNDKLDTSIFLCVTYEENQRICLSVYYLKNQNELTIRQTDYIGKLWKKITL